MRDAIGDLPLQPTGSNWHIGRNPLPSSIERYRAVPEGGNRFDLQRNRPDLTPQCWLNKPTGTTDVFGRLWWDRPALTIRTEFFKPEKGRYLHPQADRPITHREAARLMTFPDWFEFEGTKTEVARQIGNAVPPVLGAEIGRFVRKLLPDNAAAGSNMFLPNGPATTTWSSTAATSAPQACTPPTRGRHLPSPAPAVPRLGQPDPLTLGHLRYRRGRTAARFEARRGRARRHVLVRVGHVRALHRVIP